MSVQANVTHEIDEDELLSFQLRARLSEIDFSLIWRVMAQSPNWSYKGNEYFLNGKNLGSAKIAMEKLDKFALPSLSFRKEEDIAHDRELDDDLRGSRLDLLEKIFHFCKENDKPVPTYYFDVVQDPEELSFSPDSRTPHKDSEKVKPQRTKKNNVQHEPGAEQYFANVNKKNQTEKPFVQISNDGFDTKSKLKWPTPNESVNAVKKMNVKTSPSSPTMNNLKKNHEEWRFLMGTKHSLLLYGFGSKRKLLNDFATKTLQPCGDVLILNGFDPSISVSSILDLLVDIFLSGVQPSSSSSKSESFHEHDIGMIRPSPLFVPTLVKRATNIGKALGSRCTKPIYLVIHNIEGSGLRDPSSLKALVALISNSDVNDGMSYDDKDTYRNRVVQLVASIDHVDAVSFLDMEAMTNFSWVSMYIDSKIFDPCRKCNFLFPNRDILPNTLDLGANRLLRSILR